MGAAVGVAPGPRLVREDAEPPGAPGKGRDPGKGRALGKGRDPDLLHVVDLIMLAFLVSSDLALRLLGQLAQVLL